MNKIYTKFRTAVTVMLFCIAPSILLAQTKISGTVTDETQQTLPGVSVKLAGTPQGGQTDNNGRYIIAANKGQTLVFSFIGYDTQSIVIGDETVINVTLRSNSKSLNEVVVTALGVKKETRRIGYAVQTVNGSDLTTARDPNPVNGLIGKVAGLQVAATSEILGVPNVTIRG